MKLDKENLVVDEFTSVNPVTCQFDDSLQEVKRIMRENGIRHLPVCHEQVLVGLVSERRLHALNEEQLHYLKAKDVMATEILTAYRNTLLRDVVYEMSDKKIGSALITDRDNKLYGVFTSTDALNTIIELLA